MPSSSKTLQPVDHNVQRETAATPGTKMRQLKEDLKSKESENEAMKGQIDELTKVIQKLDFVKDSASVSVAPTVKDGDKKGKDKKAPVVPAKTAYKFWQESQNNKNKKQGDNVNMQQLWKECAPEIRKKYQSLAKADKERYNSEMEAYNEEQKALEMYYDKKKQEAAMAFYEAHLEAQAALEKAQDETGKAKKKKAPKDTDAPKRCMSSYMYFAQEMRSTVVEENKDAKLTEVAKILGEMWQKLDAKAKTKYEDMAAVDKERYTKEKADYDAKLAEKKQEEEDEAAARFEQDKKEAMELMEAQSVQIKNINVTGDDVSVISDITGGKPQKKKKDPNAPKRALTAYNYFMKENRDSIKSKMPDSTTNAELLAEIGKQWKALSETKKKKYNKMSAKDQERYAKEMAQYNATKK